MTTHAEIARRHREWRRLYEQEGKTLRQVAAEAGVTLQAVHYALKRQGVEMRPRRCVSADYYEAATALLRDGVARRDIPRRLGISKGALNAAIARGRIRLPDEAA